MERLRSLDKLYFDYQASTPVDENVLQKMLPFFIEKAGNPHSSDHIIGWSNYLTVEKMAQNIADMIGADSDEIVFTSGATESNNLAILGLGRRQITGTRRRILVSAIEHKCILAATRVLRDQYHYQVDTLPVDREGRVLLSELRAKLAEDVLLVSIIAVNNEIGTIQDVESISGIIRESGALFHCDASQAPVAMDMKNFAGVVDILSLSAHKMYGPQGIGALYIRRGIQDQVEPVFYGGGQQRGLRPGTIPVALCVGMGTAAAMLSGKNGLEMRKKLRHLRDEFVALLKTLPYEISLNGPIGRERHPGNANICFRGFNAQDILQTLQPHLAASTGSACTTGIPEPSHVLKAIGLTNEEAEGSIRFSLGYRTTTVEIQRATALIRHALKKQPNF